jgi:hypothetical protein
MDKVYAVYSVGKDGHHIVIDVYKDFHGSINHLFYHAQREVKDSSTVYIKLSDDNTFDLWFDGKYQNYYVQPFVLK